MNTAFSVFRYLFSKVYDFVFNSITFTSNNVSLGWVIVVIFIFSVMIKNILMLGRVGQSYSFSARREWEQKQYDHFAKSVVNYGSYKAPSKK